MLPSSSNECAESVPARGAPRRRSRGQARSVSGIVGTAEQPPPATAIRALAPPSTDAIRRARQAAARHRALAACRSCKDSRYQTICTLNLLHNQMTDPSRNASRTATSAKDPCN